MKKILLISLLIFGFILTGCSQQKWLSQDELFQKKQECASYTSEMYKDIEKWWYEEPLILDVFYSSSINSCIYEFNTARNSLTLVDYFSKKILWSALINCESYYYETCMAQQKVLFDTIKELKWE